jgi:hypothetical protein
MENINLNDITPYIALVIVALIQSHIFVTPDQLERTHREIIDEISERYATLQSFRVLEKQISHITETINKIYEKLCK